MAKKKRPLGDIVKAAEIPGRGQSFDYTANDQQRADLATRFDIPELRALTAQITLNPLAGGPMIRVTLALQADLVQNCVVTGDPVPEKIDLRVELDFAPPSMIDENIELTLDDADPPDPIENGEIDLGDVIAQQLSLALDPYPRAPDAAFTNVLDNLPGSQQKHLDREAPKNPFAVLAQLKQNASPGEETE